MTVERLFSPFWETVAIQVVKNLLNKPQTTQLMADLLGMSVSEFLVLTQSYTLPWLVLNQQGDVIQRIAEARKGSGEYVICSEPVNWCPILALLLVQPVADMEVYIMATLRAALPKFRDLDLVELVRIEPASTALCLLKAAGEADVGKKSRASVLAFDVGFLINMSGRSEWLYSSLLLTLPLLMGIKREAIRLEYSLRCMF